MLRNHASPAVTSALCRTEFGKWHGRTFIANTMNAYVIGDLHGQYGDFLKAIKLFDKRKSPNSVLYLLGTIAMAKIAMN